MESAPITHVIATQVGKESTVKMKTALGILIVLIVVSVCYLLDLLNPYACVIKVLTDLDVRNLFALVSPCVTVEVIVL